MKKIRIGTRGSELALWQANHVAGLIGVDLTEQIIIKMHECAPLLSFVRRSTIFTRLRIMGDGVPYSSIWILEQLLTNCQTHHPVFYPLPLRAVN